MALTDPKDTLAYHASRVLCQHRDMQRGAAARRSPKRDDRLHERRHSRRTRCPESEALWFYGMNHGMALIAARKRSARAARRVGEGVRQRLPHADGREGGPGLLLSRLDLHPRGAAQQVARRRTCRRSASCSARRCRQFFTAHQGRRGRDLQEVPQEDPPNATIGNYCEGAALDVLSLAAGPAATAARSGAWSPTASCRFVNGEFTRRDDARYGLDAGHNNGPIFNKGEFYAMLRSTYAVAVLDVQRSGQMPEAVPVRRRRQQVRRDPDLKRADEAAEGAVPGQDRRLRRLGEGRGARLGPQVPEGECRRSKPSTG